MKLPAEPVNCLPSPIVAIPASQTVAWTAEMESKLVTEWNAERKNLSATQRYRNKFEETDKLNMPEEKLVEQQRENNKYDTQEFEERNAPTYFTNIAEYYNDKATETNMTRVPLNCDAVPFPFNRSTGVIYKFREPHNNRNNNNDTTTTTTTTTNSYGNDHLANMSNPAYPKEVLNEIPVGVEYYEALRNAWRQPSERGALLPPRPSAEEYVPDDDAILEVLQDTVSARFSPGLPLHYIIQLLMPEWEEEGLFEIAKRRENQEPVETPQKEELH